MLPRACTCKATGRGGADPGPLEKCVRLAKRQKGKRKAKEKVSHASAGKDEYDLAEFAAYDEENNDEGAAAAGNQEKKESEK